MAEEARDRAADADSRMTAHEARCTERWNEARDTWKRVETTVQALQAASVVAVTTSAHDRTNWMSPALGGLAALTVLLLGAVGALSFYVMTHSHA